MPPPTPPSPPSQAFNVTRERIRQIEVKALLKLRDPERLWEDAGARHRDAVRELHPTSWL